jgi:hypothetical protein
MQRLNSEEVKKEVEDVKMEQANEDDESDYITVIIIKNKDGMPNGFGSSF